MTPDEFIDALERLVRSTAYEYARSTAYEYAASETAPDHPHWFLDKARAFLAELGSWRWADGSRLHSERPTAYDHEPVRVFVLKRSHADEPAGPSPAMEAVEAILQATDADTPWQIIVLAKAILELQSAQVSGGVAGSAGGKENLQGAEGESGPEPERITLYIERDLHHPRHFSWRTQRLTGPPDHISCFEVVPAEAYDRAVKAAGEWRKMFFDVQDRLLRWAGTRG